MILLALDTCDARGSVCVLRDDEALQTIAHNTTDDYSVWLLPAIDRALAASGVTFGDVETFVAAAGPGSFTGVRVGLTTVKAWAEVTGKPIVSVSRLEALATEAGDAGAGFVAAFANAQRRQIFGALYRRQGSQLQRVGEEAVIAPDQFLAWAVENSGGEAIHWISTDPEMLTETEAWAARQKDGADAAVICGVPGSGPFGVQLASPILAPVIGRLGYQLAKRGTFADPLTLDANYVRRSDAEVSWMDRQTKAAG
jgi:tRNA threonylcarbamoyladenosine biosynthesis protein TsaB